MTERRNDRKTERQKDRQGKSSIAPTFSKRGYNNKLKKKQCRERLCVTHMSKLEGTQAILQVYYIFLVWYKNEFNLKSGNI